MFILLPPSEGKATGGKGPVKLLNPAALDDTKHVLRQLTALSPKLYGELYGITDPAKATAAHRLNDTVLEGPGLKALDRYTGVVYGHIDPATLTHRAKAEKHLLIVSAMYGLIRGSDRIANYKLPMSGEWARWWHPINTSRLHVIAKSAAVVSLLPQAQGKAINLDGVVPVDFRIAGGKKAAGHFGKAIKGRFVRFILENEIRRVSDFAAFSEDGYRWDGTNFIQGG